MTDWIEWKGGACPVPPETLVEIRTADGLVSVNLEAGDAMGVGEINWWQHQCHPDDHIIAYRIIKEQPFANTAPE